MRINRKDIDAAISGLNKYCERIGLPAQYHAERANGGYKRARPGRDFVH